MSHVPCIKQMWSAYKISVRKHQGKKTFGRSRYTWETNIKMDLKDVGYEAMNWIKFVQDHSRIVVFYVHGTEC
jgi:hypothetical protein